jgi:hypothetical protein
MRVRDRSQAEEEQQENQKQRERHDDHQPLRRRDKLLGLVDQLKLVILDVSARERGRPGHGKADQHRGPRLRRTEWRARRVKAVEDVRHSEREQRLGNYPLPAANSRVHGWHNRPAVPDRNER